jgi:hypothetical protein
MVEGQGEGGFVLDNPQHFATLFANEEKYLCNTKTEASLWQYGKKSIEK